MSTKVLGVKIDTVTEGQALDLVAKFLREGRDHYIFTPNPEMVMAAQNDYVLREILNRGDLNICDGKGIKLTCDLLYDKNNKDDLKYFKRISGVDFMLDICDYANRYGFSIYLLGSGSEKTISIAAKKLKDKFPKLNIVGYHPGPIVESIPNKKLKYRSNDNHNVITDIIQTQPDILFVGFGHGKQEKWIAENTKKLPGVKIVMGVGGSFDFISGKIMRAPKILRKMGLEWMWRLLQEPSRIKRVWTALVEFPLAFIKYRDKDKELN
ncbi:MAG: hypothetical protein A2725_04395 [Candidatus Magasanikbacteria bacterium RIFCSPHIGHO2_01_FULL_33_34]|uniref:Glycosyltransferase n=1 Tax=Candidatus Magasanikbacteria bacterium RIFCSPHIGHO2_01_FULL_33_34 TaxID=1798671 RepID=A0A1F6LI27_9BACT|nr:MAG: hypothetical protein A2725_04395 [Candidatus Magasanikbacteria bacterium RIFCSPHIGHO2_01_FULL_33_34]OGH65231.1 MAG: hypothetical protein A3B83_04155 [Candidatus Magasanikbacteria bacterium RIFCSPHIGHO2_02_FULL_33_17]OGH75415.1 MAG: hypothetical protein A3A89_04010 [Candidatus Magasanikbacteria bacterium RIFCSPLOWO2_01_FULL_33_34]OGH82191.1 MAG: hypothetical protein A3F93_00405 [Candidatus Magasanikbacteria bacterium RIFCSPLOWO2_12_FULL_34_7]